MILTELKKEFEMLVKTCLYQNEVFENQSYIIVKSSKSSKNNTIK